MWQLRRTATWGRLTRRQSSSALSTTPMPSLKSLNLSADVLQRFYCWYVTLRCDLDLWSWTFVVCRLCRGQSLYQIWAQSSNSRLSYRDLNIWPNYLEHAWLCDNFHQVWTRSTYLLLIYWFSFCCWYVMLRCDFDFWPHDLESLWYIVCHALTICSDFWMKSNHPRLSYW